MTGRTERQYRRRAHYPARINFGITNELRAALEALADKADTCVAEVAQRTKERRTVNRRRRTMRRRIVFSVAALIAVLATPGCQESTITPSTTTPPEFGYRYPAISTTSSHRNLIPFALRQGQSEDIFIDAPSLNHAS